MQELKRSELHTKFGLITLFSYKVFKSILCFMLRIIHINRAANFKAKPAGDVGEEGGRIYFSRGWSEEGGVGKGGCS